MTITDAPAFPKVDLDKPVPMEVIRFVVAHIAERFKPEKIILFGSHAYGDPKPWSDVDLLVVMDTEKTEHDQRLEIARSLHGRTFSIDVIVRTPGNLSRRIENRDYFLREIVNKGRVMYARPNG
ncbi:MAG: nucleotidyltransferase domain-containing protein [Chloroflexi bacterium]|nr:nucleotidyltransferase domain-containing protein [Chloroflexota bacterium]